MKFDTITIDRQDAIWLVTLNRPERLNAMSQKMLLEMDSACDMIEEDTSCRVVVLTGSGKAFTPALISRIRPQRHHKGLRHGARY